MLWFLIALAYCYMHQVHFDNPMARSRLDLLHALVTKHTFSIDAYQWNTEDKSFANGHFYCDKAPGVVLLALPWFYLSSKILPAIGVPLESPDGSFVSSWISTAGSVGVITALGCVFLYLFLQEIIPARSALLCTFVMAFGSMAFAYATMLLSHGMVIGLICIALWCLVPPPTTLGSDPAAEGRSFNIRIVGGGFACGLAIACEYDSALVVGGIVIVLLLRNCNRASAAITGAVPPLLLIPIYNWICLGTPFSLPYGHEAIFKEMNTGLYGIHYPQTENCIWLLFSPQRGLFFWTPFLLLAFIGYPFLYRSSPSLFWLCYLLPILQVVVMSGYYTVNAGQTLGPRFLSPIVPLLIIPAGIAAAKLPWIGFPCAILSIIEMAGATMVDARSPALATVLDDKVITYYILEFQKGTVSHNLGALIGLKPHWQMVPLILTIVVGSCFLARHPAKEH